MSNVKSKEQIFAKLTHLMEKLFLRRRSGTNRNKNAERDHMRGKGAESADDEILQKVKVSRDLRKKLVCGGENLDTFQTFVHRKGSSGPFSGLKRTLGQEPESLSQSMLNFESFNCLSFKLLFESINKQKKCI